MVIRVNTLPAKISIGFQKVHDFVGTLVGDVGSGEVGAIKTVMATLFKLPGTLEGLYKDVTCALKNMAAAPATPVIDEARAAVDQFIGVFLTARIEALKMYDNVYYAVTEIIPWAFRNLAKASKQAGDGT